MKFACRDVDFCKYAEVFELDKNIDPDNKNDKEFEQRLRFGGSYKGGQAEDWPLLGQLFFKQAAYKVALRVCNQN